MVRYQRRRGDRLGSAPAAEDVSISGLLATLGWFIREIGFPVFVALYLLVQVDPTLTAMREAMVDLTSTLQDVHQGQQLLLEELRRR